MLVPGCQRPKDAPGPFFDMTFFMFHSYLLHISFVFGAAKGKEDKKKVITGYKEDLIKT